MAQPVSDQAAFLSEASRAVQELSACKKSVETMRLEEKKLEKELEGERKAVADAISITVKKRVGEINDTYDQEISKGQERLKKIRSKREKAKSQGVKERIADETSGLVEHNQELKQQMKAVFRQNHVPRYCSSPWYYALYIPRGFSEYMTLLLTVLVCFLAVPCGIYFLLPKRSPWYLVGIYFVTIVLFGGVYTWIGNRTKLHHSEALRQGRDILDVIKSNDKKIRVITTTIKRDRNEAVYDLEKYDDEIARTEQELSKLAAQKKEALNTFDKVTKTIIADEISDGSRDHIRQLREGREELASRVREAENEIKEKTLYITNHYESYIGREFMTPEKLDELADMIRLGKAASISDAESIYRNSRNA